MGEKLRGDSAEASAALSRQGRYHTVAGNLRVKEVRVDNGTARDRFVISSPPLPPAKNSSTTPPPRKPPPNSPATDNPIRNHRDRTSLTNLGQPVCKQRGRQQPPVPPPFHPHLRVMDEPSSNDGSARSPPRSCNAPPTATSKNSPPTSEPGPTNGTRTRHHSCGTRPPNESSNASPATAKPSTKPPPQHHSRTTLQDTSRSLTLGGTTVRDHRSTPLAKRRDGRPRTAGPARRRESVETRYAWSSWKIGRASASSRQSLP